MTFRNLLSPYFVIFLPQIIINHPLCFFLSYLIIKKYSVFPENTQSFNRDNIFGFQRPVHNKEDNYIDNFIGIHTNGL